MSKEAKLALAEYLVAFYHSPEIAKQTRAEFERVFCNKGIPDNIPTVRIHKDGRIECLKTYP